MITLWSQRLIYSQHKEGHCQNNYLTAGGLILKSHIYRLKQKLKKARFALKKKFNSNIIIDLVHQYHYLKLIYPDRKYTSLPTFSRPRYWSADQYLGREKVGREVYFLSVKFINTIHHNKSCKNFLCVLQLKFYSFPKKKK